MKSLSKIVTLTVLLTLTAATVFAQSSRVTLTITANAPNAQVFINNSNRGQAPVTEQLRPGTYTIRVVAPNYQEYDTTINLSRDQTLNAQLQPNTFNLSVSSNAGNAIVYIDNNNRGGVPYSENLKPGVYNLRVSADGYRDYATTVNMDRDQRINAQLEPDRYTLTVSSNVGNAQVFINNANRGTGTIREELRPGTYDIRVTAPGYLDFTTRISLNSDQRISATLQPATATVTVQVPASLIDRDYRGSETLPVVFVDGRQMSGTTFEVPPGRHTIKVRIGGWAVEQTYSFSPAGIYRIVPSMGVDIQDAGGSSSRGSFTATATVSSAPAQPEQRSPGAAANRDLSGWWSYEEAMAGRGAASFYYRFDSNGDWVQRDWEDQTQVAGSWRWNGNTLELRWPTGGLYKEFIRLDEVTLRTKEAFSPAPDMELYDYLRLRN